MGYYGEQWVGFTCLTALHRRFSQPRTPTADTGSLDFPSNDEDRHSKRLADGTPTNLGCARKSLMTQTTSPSPCEALPWRFLGQTVPVPRLDVLFSEWPNQRVGLALSANDD